jgi:hypothetical protein
MELSNLINDEQEEIESLQISFLEVDVLEEDRVICGGASRGFKQISDNRVNKVN